MGRNALTTEARENRRAALLEAAHNLFCERRSLPAVADIARAAGLAKGTVYLYFETKEEIFVAALAQQFERLFAGLMPLLDQLPVQHSQVPEAFTAGYCALIADTPHLMPLAALANGVLEQNLPAEPMRQFKTGLASSLTQAGNRLEQRTALGPAGAGTTLLLHTYSLTLGLWQALDYPSQLRELLQEASLRTLDRDFNTELRTAVQQLWRGAYAAQAQTR